MSQNQNQKSNRKLQKALKLVDMFYDFIEANMKKVSNPLVKAMLTSTLLMFPKRQNAKNELMKSFKEEDMDKLMAKLKEVVDDYYAPDTN